MDDRKALFAAVAAAAAGEGTGDRYESLVAYAKRHISRYDTLLLMVVSGGGVVLRSTARSMSLSRRGGCTSVVRVRLQRQG